MRPIQFVPPKVWTRGWFGFKMCYNVYPLLKSSLLSESVLNDVIILGIIHIFRVLRQVIFCVYASPDSHLTIRQFVVFALGSRYQTTPTPSRLYSKHCYTVDHFRSDWNGQASSISFVEIFAWWFTLWVFRTWSLCRSSTYVAGKFMHLKTAYATTGTTIIYHPSSIWCSESAVLTRA